MNPITNQSIKTHPHENNKRDNFMNTYNYYSNVLNDVMSAIIERDYIVTSENIDELRDILNDELWRGSIPRKASKLLNTNIMKYFKTPERLDGKRVLLDAKKGHYFEFVANELFTEKEVAKMGLNTAIFEPMEISKRLIYYSFGVRFSL